LRQISLNIDILRYTELISLNCICFRQIYKKQKTSLDVFVATGAVANA